MTIKKMTVVVMLSLVFQLSSNLIVTLWQLDLISVTSIPSWFSTYLGITNVFTTIALLAFFYFLYRNQKVA